MPKRCWSYCVPRGSLDLGTLSEFVERDSGAYCRASMNTQLAETEISVVESFLAQLDTLKATWLSVQPLSSENERRLKQKLRLEWNYNSNHIEGNTLTYGETELLLIQGQTVGGHTIREYEEMKAHDVAVDYVDKLAREERVIGETDIRDLNKIILKEPFWKECETLDGNPTRKQIIPGEYKVLPNNVRTATGEIFEFAKPAETASRMGDLVRWLHDQLETSQHPVKIAAKLHDDFLLIHPFDDGNGRVGRLLINYVLLRAGFPPLIIKSADKANYLAALRLADVGQLEALTDYLAHQLEWSLNLALRAANGESLDEPSDIEKEIVIFIREQEANRIEVKKRSAETFRELYKSGWEHLFSTFEEKIRKLSPLFSETVVTVNPTGRPEYRNDWRRAFQHFVEKTPHHHAFQIQIGLKGYKGAAELPFGVDSILHIQFDEFRYSINAGFGNLTTKLYSEPILSDEADSMVNVILRRTFDAIKKKAAGEKSKSKANSAVRKS
jgi:cell filamentation protein, protein adenylyltransferase